MMDLNDDSLIIKAKRPVPDAIPPTNTKREIISRDEVIQKYNEWLKNTKYLDEVDKLGIEWMGPGFIIEIFAPDFSEKTSLVGLDGFYLKISPYARILSASPENEGPRAKLKAGDIVYIGDAASNIKKNIEHERWADAKAKGSGKFDTPEPIEWIRSVHAWVQQGKLFFTDKAAYMVDSELTQMDQARMNKFSGPFIFEVDLGVVKHKISNPWG